MCLVELVSLTGSDSITMGSQPLECEVQTLD
jgi:hypothetical protein